MGAPASSARPSPVPARSGTRPAVQLGGMAQTFPQVHESQEVPSNGSVPQDGQGQQWTDPAGSVYRWNHRNEIRHLEAGNERCGRFVRSQWRRTDRLAGVYRCTSTGLARPQAKDRRRQDPRRSQTVGDALYLSTEVPSIPGWRRQISVWRLPEAASSAYSTKYCDGSRRRWMGST